MKKKKKKKERSHFLISPLIFLNLGQTLNLVINISTTSQNQSSYDSKVSLVNRRYTSRVNWYSLVKGGEKKEWQLIFQLYLSYFNRTPLNINFSRGCEFYICFTNIWFIYNSSAMHWWLKENWLLKVYWIPICLAEYASYEPRRFETHEYNRTQE